MRQLPLFRTDSALLEPEEAGRRCIEEALQALCVPEGLMLLPDAVCQRSPDEGKSPCRAEDDNGGPFGREGCAWTRHLQRIGAGRFGCEI